MCEGIAKPFAVRSRLQPPPPPIPVPTRQVAGRTPDSGCGEEGKKEKKKKRRVSLMETCGPSKFLAEETGVGEVVLLRQEAKKNGYADHPFD